MAGRGLVLQTGHPSPLARSCSECFGGLEQICLPRSWASERHKQQLHWRWLFYDLGQIGEMFHLVQFISSSRPLSSISCTETETPCALKYLIGSFDFGSKSIASQPASLAPHRPDKRLEAEIGARTQMSSSSSRSLFLEELSKRLPAPSASGVPAPVFARSIKFVLRTEARRRVWALGRSIRFT